MKGSKLWMTVFVAVLILSFTVTTVGAQGQIPPVGEPDGDGDLIVDVFPKVDISAAVGLPDPENLAAYADFARPGGTISVDITPIFPVGNVYYYTKYPRFKFTQVEGAIKYKIEVYDIVAEPDVLLYTFKGPPVCAASVCELVPTTALKPVTIFLNKGYYGWRVKAKTAEGWDPVWSTPAYFYALKDGFNSTFTTLDSKWYPVKGEWTLTSAGYAKTTGIFEKFSTAIEKHFVYEGFVYEVRMKRKVEEVGSNSIIFQGYPFPLDEDNEDWHDGYRFSYDNRGYWGVNKNVNGVTTLIHPIYSESTIDKYGWNTLTVMVIDPFIYFWINGEYVGFVQDDASFEGGYVGVGMYEENVDVSPLLVDYANLDYTATAPYPFAVTEDGKPDPAYKLDLVEVTPESEPVN